MNGFHDKLIDHHKSTINNLQTAYFSTFATIIASGVIGVLIGYNDLAVYISGSITSESAALFLFLFLLIYLLLIGITECIFIFSILSGFRIVLIERKQYGTNHPHGEFVHFCSVADARPIQRWTTRIFCPGIYDSGLVHRFCPLLFWLNSTGIMCFVSLHLWFFSQIDPSTMTGSAAIRDGMSFLSDNALSTLGYAAIVQSILIYLLPKILPGRNERSQLFNTRCLVVSDTLSHIHGTEVAIFTFLKSVPGRGAYTVVGPRESESRVVRQECRRLAVRLHLFPSISSRFLGQPDFRLAVPFGLGRFLESVHLVVIQGFPGPLSIAAIRLAHKRRIPSLFFYHIYLPVFVECVPIIGASRISKNLADFFTRLFANRCSNIVVPSVFVKRHLLWIGIRKPISVVPHPTSPFFLEDVPRSHIDAIRDTLGPGRLILYVGRLSQEKNLTVLIDALASRHLENVQCSLVIVGKGPLERQLRRYVLRLKPAKRVIFSGYQNWPKLRLYYHACDVFCTASRGETQGLSILEAKACGLPVIVLGGSGSSEQVENSVDGFIIAPESDEGLSEQFARKLSTLLRKEELRHRMGMAARARAAELSMESYRKQIAGLVLRKKTT